MDAQYTGRKLDELYVNQRAKWEPVYEITQIKGDGEAHPILSPSDEFADYETWDKGNLDLTELKKDEMLEREYARSALKLGLQLETKLGTNPYKFGMVGATDSHTSLSTAEEENFFGKSVTVEPSKTRIEHPFIESKLGAIEGYELVAAGYQGVWASENTREAIFDAMERKETYATTGPRIPVRFFGGWEYTDDDLRSRAPAFRGYEKGVPMGGDLRENPGKEAPVFMVYALRDPIGANLDRIQIIKGWLDGQGELHEKIYDVAWSDMDKRKPDPRTGKLPPVGNTVDVKQASYENSIGSAQLSALWRDPAFDPEQHAFYYARVVENPSCRWSQRLCVAAGVDCANPDTIGKGYEGCCAAEHRPIIQERAWTSPIWYQPTDPGCSRISHHKSLDVGRGYLVGRGRLPGVQGVRSEDF